MGQAMFAGLSRPGAPHAREVLLGAATATVIVVSLVLAVLGVASAEVVATVLFLPVFAAGLLAGRVAGYVAAGTATVVYLAMRSGDLSGAGVASAGVLALTRAAAYGVAGHVGGLAQRFVGGAASASRPRGAGARTARAPGPVVWDDPVNDERSTRADGRVLAVVGPPGAAASYEVEDAGYGDGSMTTSGGWPPDPPQDPEPEAAPGPHPHREASWGGGVVADGGWHDRTAAGDRPQEAPGAAGVSTWGPDTRSASADDWDAVQQSWRRQDGPAPDDPAETGPAAGHDDWATEASAAPASDRWAMPPANGGGHPSDPWGTPATGGRHPSDPWGTPPANGGGHPSDPWGTPTTGDRHPSDPSGTPPANGRGGTETDPWGTPIGPGAPGGWAPPAPATQPPGPASPWSGLSGSTWPERSPQPPAWDPSPSGTAAPADGPWSPVGDRGDTWSTPGAQHESWPSGPESDESWPSGPESDQSWASAPRTDDSWPSGPESDQSWASAPRTDESWGSAPQTNQSWSSRRETRDAWSAPASAAPSPAPAQRRAEPVDLPAVDPETGLWTARFLRDRLAAERARSRRSGRPCSIVLVQVPDGPLAQLPYRRQVTLLRELGYQFVTGGVVDHLVHVPDQQQHWFAVILPDTDRSGAQVLERRLRLGIGGYLASRGLRLRDLESASLTAPDDDPAMEQIWEALIGPDGDDAGYG